MVTTYTIILCFSACFTAFVLVRGAQLVARLSGLTDRLPAGAYILLSLLGFLMVAAAPAKLLSAMLLLTIAGVIGVFNYLPSIARWGMPLIAAVLASTSTPLPAIPGIPNAMVPLLAMGLLFALTMAAEHGADDTILGGSGVIAALLPLVVAPLIFGAPSYLALDAALVAAALAGGALAAPAGATLGFARAPFALLTGWLILRAVAYGAWPCALVSLAVTTVFIALYFMRADRTGQHAL
jgi:hypothetical protein